MANSDVVIAGGGLGGLFCGALLARNGLKVTVLEKNGIPGGGLQTFTRRGTAYDTGMHIMGGWHPGGTLDRITRYLGIRESLDISHVSDRVMDTVTSLDDGATYGIPAGFDSFVDRMSEYFPGQREGLERYVAKMKDIADQFDLYNLRPYADTRQSHAMMPEGVLSVNDFIRTYITEPRLAALLAYTNGLYAGEKGVTPAYVHSLISILYLKGASRFANHSRQLADSLVKVIEDAGGSVRCNCAVVGIDADENRHITAFKSEDGSAWTAEKYVWAAHPSILVPMMPPRVFTKAYAQRVMSIRPTVSAFSLYVKFKPDAFKYIDHTCYVNDSLLNVWNIASPDEDGIPSGFMYMTPPSTNQGPYAGTMLITALMDYSVVAKWENSVTGHRPEEYYEWKGLMAKGILEKISRIHPDIESSIMEVYTSSPLTVRDYYGAPTGAIYGFAKDCNHLVESRLPIVTKSPNLFFTGQCVNLHGICGVPLTAITTAEAILFPKTIIQDM